MKTEITSIPYPSYAISRGQKGAPEAGEMAHYLRALGVLPNDSLWAV